MSKKSAFKRNVDEIFYNLINSLLAGILVLVGSFSSGTIDKSSLFIAGVSAVIVFTVQFKNYWEGQKSEYTTLKLFNFIG